MLLTLAVLDPPSGEPPRTGGASPPLSAPGDRAPFLYLCSAAGQRTRGPWQLRMPPSGVRGPTGAKGRARPRPPSDRELPAERLRTAFQRAVAEPRQRGSHGSRRAFYPLPTETKERDERAGAANQRGAGAGSRAGSSRMQTHACGGGGARGARLGAAALPASRAASLPGLEEFAALPFSLSPPWLNSAPRGLGCIKPRVGWRSNQR